MSGGDGDRRPVQIPFDFAPPRRRAFGREDFTPSPSNADALALIDGWRGWPERRLALIGPEGAGKTHLVHVWMALAGAERVSAERLSLDDVPSLTEAGAFAVEDADRICGDRERERPLFHLLNLAKEAEATVLLTGRTPPRRWGAATPDLASRLTALTVAAIEAPDDELLARLFLKHFADRRLAVDEDLIRYLVPRIERSAAAVASAVARLDEAALTEARRITRSFAREALNLR